MSILAALLYIPSLLPMMPFTFIYEFSFPLSSNHHCWPLLPQHAQLLQGNQPGQDQVSGRDNTHSQKLIEVKPSPILSHFNLKALAYQFSFGSTYFLCGEWGPLALRRPGWWATEPLMPGARPLSVLSPISHLTTQPPLTDTPCY